MNARREMIAQIIEDFSPLPPSEADHLAGMIDAALDASVDDNVISAPGERKPQIKRKKLAASSYELQAFGVTVAHATRTGEYSRDDYPWDWYIADGIEFIDKRADGRDVKSGGSSDSLRDIIDTLAGSIAQYGLRRK